MTIECSRQLTSYLSFHPHPSAVVREPAGKAELPKAAKEKERTGPTKAQEVSPARSGSLVGDVDRRRSSLDRAIGCRIEERGVAEVSLGRFGSTIDDADSGRSSVEIASVVDSVASKPAEEPECRNVASEI